MQLVLMTLVGTGLLGCFGAALGVDLSGRGRRDTRDSRRLARPKSMSIAREVG